jgi:hypothetical protein
MQTTIYALVSVPSGKDFTNIYREYESCRNNLALYGVKKNYQLFQGVEVSTEGKKKQTINLLSKI